MVFFRNASNKLRQIRCFSTSNLFTGGLPFSTDDSSLREEVVSGRSRGFGFDSAAAIQRSEESKSAEGIADDYGRDEPVKGNYRDVLDSLSDGHQFRTPRAQIMTIVEDRKSIPLAPPSQGEDCMGEEEYFTFSS